MKPIIGLFCAVDDEATTSVLHPYAAAFEAVGGLPILLPYTENESTICQFIDMCDGICFTGGADIAPARYGEDEKEHCGKIEQLRDAMEFAALRIALKTSKPIMGICRGSQLINVALGGTLYQDLPSECPSPIMHVQTEAKLEFSHEIKLLPNTPLAALFGTERVRANSFHHQSVKTLGRDLCIMVTADDGVIEGFYLPGERYLRGYQWHPERLCAKDEYSQMIFHEFIVACQDKQR